MPRIAHASSVHMYGAELYHNRNAAQKNQFQTNAPRAACDQKAYLHATGHLLAGCCSGGKEDVAAVALLFHAFDCLEGGQNFPNPTAKQQSRVFRRINKNILDSTTMLSRRL